VETMNDNVRYWDRVGMYVTKEFAEEWIERVNSHEGDSAGRYLAEDIDEYEDSTVGASAGQLRREIEKLFEEDFKQVELPPSTRAIIVAAEMDKNKKNRLREMMAEGMEKQEAKLKVQEEIDDAVSEILGIAKEEMTITQGIEELKEYSIPDYDSLEVFELKNMLKQRGHETKGRKNTLIERLIEFDVSMIPLNTPDDRITYGENYSEMVEALLNGRREEEEE
tara:strand:+ start:1538 stop:2206 length:669 start_codon:yes stop_codon:yes gene_type:complete